MTLDDVYGTHADHLPRAMIKLVREDRQGRNKLLRWVGVDGAQLLSLVEHLYFEQECLGNFPRKSDGSIDWEDVDPGLVMFSQDFEDVDLREIIRDRLPTDDTVVFLWGSLSVPSVKMSSEIAIRHMSGIVESRSEFWIYSLKSRLTLEYSFSGLVTMAHAPTGGRHAGTRSWT